LIATTNLSDEEFGHAPRSAADYKSYTLSERLGIRARSRIFQMCRVVKMLGADDYRLRKAR
jgi:DNA replication protein DnaC